MSYAKGLLEACASGDKTKTTRAFGDFMYCVGFIDGVGQSLAGFHLIDVPSEVTSGQLRGVVVKYMQDHPELLHQRSAALVKEALTKVWPAKN